MEVEKITIDQAIKEGYKLCIVADDDYCKPLVDLKAENLTPKQLLDSEIYLCEKEPTHFKMKDSHILDILYNKGEEVLTSIIDDEYCCDDFEINLEGVIYDDEVKKAEQILIKAINAAIVKNTGGIYSTLNCRIVG